MKVIDVYSKCPIRNKTDKNGSENFTELMIYQTSINDPDIDRTYELIRHIHVKIEEKFKDFRMAFWSFDKNYDGGLSFKEFIFGLENLGVKFKYEDFWLVFNFVDFDNTWEIDFNKFCLLNTDKVKLRHWKAMKAQSHNSIT